MGVVQTHRLLHGKLVEVIIENGRAGLGLWTHSAAAVVGLILRVE